MNQILLLSFLMGMIIIPTGCTTTRGFREPIENFDKVDDKLYRGAQPNAVGIEALKARGIDTVINLRDPKDSWSEEESYVTNAGMAYVQVALNPLIAPSHERIERILGVISRSPGPVLVHCEFGCERTGVVVACYRVRVLAETNERALNDAVAHGMSAWAVAIKGFIRHFK